MKNINNYLEFLLEKKHICFDCIDFRDDIMNKINIKSIYQNLKNSNRNILNTTIEIVLNGDNFKINNLKLDITLYKYKENVCNGLTKLNISEVISGILYNAKIDIDIYIENLDKEIQDKISSTILHELVHIYEFYNLRMKNKFRPKSWSIGTILPKLRKEIKNKDIQSILNLLYYSLKHEISAQLHQYYDYKKNSEEYLKLDIIQKELNNFNIDIKINDNFISEIEIIRKNIYEEIKSNLINKQYLKDLNKSLWCKQVTKENIKSFLIELKNLFTESADYISKKKNLIDKKYFWELTEKWNPDFFKTEF